jgi:hypothetical protein
MHRPGITPIGNAAQLMAPFGGVGANRASDEYERGEAILGKWGDGGLEGEKFFPRRLRGLRREGSRGRRGWRGLRR